MDPVSIGLALLLKNPQVLSGAASVAGRAAAPAAVDIAKMQGSIADLSRGVLLCYHKTARFHLSDVVQAPWPRQSQYGAENSAVLRIQYSGLTAAHYQMVVAVMAKDNQLRTAVLQDSATVPYNKHCQLEEWTGS